MKPKAAAAARVLRMLGPFLGLVCIIAVFTTIDCIQAHREMRDPTYLTAANFVNVSNQTVIIAIAAFGMTMVIVSAGIDLSAGSVIALASVVVALVLQGADKQGTLGRHAALIPLAAAFAGIATGGAAGLTSGLLITRLRVVPFIITLGMMGIARGGAKMIAGNQRVEAPVSWVGDVMATPPDPSWYHVSWGVWVMAALAVLTALVMRYTVFGRHAFAIGSNEATARLCGVDVPRTKLAIYTLNGCYTGIAGVMMFSTLGVGDPTVAFGKELDVIAAVVIGGGSLAGGEGSILGTIIGAYIMSFLRSGCTTIGLQNYFTEIFIGASIIIAVAIDRFRHGRRE